MNLPTKDISRPSTHAAKPTFLCLGAPKSGTTTLYYILSQHPEIFVSEVKETNFFSDETEYGKGMSFYSTYFFPNSFHKVAGELDPSYLAAVPSPSRIHACLGKQMKFIVLLRHPVDRAYSHYKMMHRQQREVRSLEQALAEEKEFCGSDIMKQFYFGYIHNSLYAQSLKRYFQFYEASQFSIHIFEDDFVSHKSRFIYHVQQFLGVSPLPLYAKLTGNAPKTWRSHWLNRMSTGENPLRQTLRRVVPLAAKKQIQKSIQDINKKELANEPLSASLRQEYFRRYFAREVKDLENLLGHHIPIWNSNPSI
jgi:hypothetical protein